jgi:hypothetical protein
VAAAAAEVEEEEEEEEEGGSIISSGGWTTSLQPPTALDAEEFCELGGSTLDLLPKNDGKEKTVTRRRGMVKKVQNISQQNEQKAAIWNGLNRE